MVLAALGYDRLALLAATGAFTVIYGGWLRPRERARFAPLVSLALFACAAAGVLAAGIGAGVALAFLLDRLMGTVEGTNAEMDNRANHLASVIGRTRYAGRQL